jgi:hypothetical protein
MPDNGKDIQSRKWRITVNNPDTKGLDHANIKEILSTLKSITYYSFADEIGGEEQTYHTYILYTVIEVPYGLAR